MTLEHTELEWSGIAQRETLSKEFDIYCFGLVLLELISQSCHFKILCKMLSKGMHREILQNLDNEDLRDLVAAALEPDAQKRAGISQLQEHPFFKNKENDHEVVRFNPELKTLIQKKRQELMTRRAEKVRENKSFLRTTLMSSFQDSMLSHNQSTAMRKNISKIGKRAKAIKNSCDDSCQSKPSKQAASFKSSTPLANQLHKAKKPKKEAPSLNQEAKKKGQSGKMRVPSFKNEEDNQSFSPDEKGKNKKVDKMRKSYASSILKSPGRTEEKLEERKIEQEVPNNLQV